jgi:hypothetical protein
MKIPATYIDKFGSLKAEIQNDGAWLHLDISGTRFTSGCLDDF